MKFLSKTLLVLSIVLLLMAAGFYLEVKYSKPTHSQGKTQQHIQSFVPNKQLQDGDLIFHTSRSAQSKAIQLATNSTYSHCGIVYKQENEFYVYEAVQPVSTTPLAKWIARGEKGHFVVKRLKNAEQVLTPSVLAKMKQVGEEFAGKNYDLYFEWSDDKIYCSELIWKFYQRATGLEIGNLQQLKEFNLRAKPVQEKMRERYGKKIPYEEKVISPASMFSSSLLVTVIEK